MTGPPQRHLFTHPQRLGFPGDWLFWGDRIAL